MKKKINKMNAISILVALIHTIITFFTDKMIFELNSINIINYYFCKVLVFVILVLFWRFVFKTIFKRSNDNIKYVKYFLIYILPMVVVLFLIWSGVWYCYDVYNFFNYAINT